MQYKQAVHDQALFAATEGLALYKQLRLLSQENEGTERELKAKHLQKRLSNHSARCMTLGYIYSSVGRDDLQDLIEGLVVIMIDESITALVDPEGWNEACKIAGDPSERPVVVPEQALREWRLKFIEAISK